MSAPSAAFERPRPGASNTVFKSGPLFISSKGIGWKSWKKRWFILTRTSLVFFKNDPSALPQRGGEVNLTLGGIDLNNSGSVVVREDKKLLTVLFPDGRDGRAFTLKAETSEDLLEWKTALEQALAQAPSAALVMGHNGIFRSDASDSIEGSFHQWRDKRPIKSLVVGRPILLALEDIDGGPSFLEKALQFLEKYGTKVEGILRQSADVEEVDRRVQEYEQGKTEFGPEEDAHVVGDCVKHVLRELPSSPVPASCCTALLEAYKIDRKEARINAMRCAILETFPEPNRRLLQRILKMMHTIGSHSQENRMTPSAIAACMAPLLLRPLLAGECELEDEFDASGDSSAQLLAAANAANNAQAIITTLLEEYENIFDEENIQRCSMSADSQVENSGSEDSTDDDNIDVKENGYHDAENEVDQETDDDADRIQSGKLSESSGYAGSDLYDYKAFGGDDSDVGSSSSNHAKTENANLNAVPDTPLSEDQNKQRKGSENPVDENDASNLLPSTESYRSMGEILSSMDPGNHLPMPEIALAEADVARLKQKVAELHHQLNQQRQHHYGSLTDVGDRYQHAQNHPQQRFLQQDFDSTLAFVNHERKQRTEESLLGTDWRNIKGQVLASGRQPSRKQFLESSPSDSKSTEASTSMSVDDLGALDSASVPSTSRAAEVGEYARHPSVASSTLVELTTRLDFFKERRSQLMEQLHNLDLNYGSTTSQDFVYKPSSPSWS
ncbi:hypothetical protein AAZV13_14G033500 [Glycine max]